MSELISGKEALIALANGEEVEGNIGNGWYPIPLDKDVLLNSFISEKNRDGEHLKFRLKPRTITINGIEVPAPFEPNDGDRYYYISFEFEDGYSSWNTLGCHLGGAWRTEEEIKQVAAVLRSVFRTEGK